MAARAEGTLDETVSVAGVQWGKPLKPDGKHTWLTNETQEEFAKHISIGGKNAEDAQRTIFSTFCNGVKSNNDGHVYDFNREQLAERARGMVESYQMEQLRWQKHGGGKKSVEDVIKIDPAKLKWIRRTKRELERGTETRFEEAQLRRALYRPFTKRWFFMNRVFCEDLYRLRSFFPNAAAEKENRVIAVTDLAGRSPFSVMMANSVTDLHLCATTDLFQVAYTTAHRIMAWTRIDDGAPKVTF